MKQLLIPFLFTAILGAWSCSGNSDSVDTEEREARAPAVTEDNTELPADVIYATKPLINGKLYNHPDFESRVVAYFDTSQQLFVLDASDNIFVKARFQQDTSQHTGYLPRAILPER